MTQQRCPMCEAPWAAVNAARWGRCGECDALQFVAGDGPEVLLAHASDDIAIAMGTVLSEARFRPVRARTGSDALRLVDTHGPRGIVLDVGLDDVMSFQIIEHVRGTPELADAKVVLVASVFNRTAYKRRPSSLYGADDYVEQHHIPDMLAPKLCALLGLAAPEAPTEVRARVEKIQEGEERHDLRGEERVAALARSIVADIALYNEVELQETARDADFTRLEPALDEGRRVLSDQLDADTVIHGDPILAAFHQLLDEMRGGDR